MEIVSLKSIVSGIIIGGFHDKTVHLLNVYTQIRIQMTESNLRNSLIIFPLALGMKTTLIYPTSHFHQGLPHQIDPFLYTKERVD